MRNRRLGFVVLGCVVGGLVSLACSSSDSGGAGSSSLTCGAVCAESSENRLIQASSWDSPSSSAGCAETLTNLENGNPNYLCNNALVTPTGSNECNNLGALFLIELDFEIAACTALHPLGGSGFNDCMRDNFPTGFSPECVSCTATATENYVACILAPETLTADDLPGCIEARINEQSNCS